MSISSAGTRVRNVSVATALAGALAAGSAAAAGPVHREHEINDSRATASGPLLSGSTWTGALNTRNDGDWFKLYLGRRTQVSITVTNTSRRGNHPVGYQLIGRENEIHWSSIFDSGRSKTLTRTFPSGVAWVHVGAVPGYEINVPTTYRITIHSSSKLLRHAPSGG